ncbi:hypothetical protein GCM10009799_26830 [Nocardiopsis rhodophaea]|uniref:Uncharacterized protein n=1 Tax=Nocardiopsis rhodophaea TaxID=280238 RepID=A0ABN2T4L4_9ACTN
MSSGRGSGSDDVVDFFLGDWNITDRRQNQRIRELQEGLDQANQRVYHERSRLRSELSQVRGSLEKRLDAISASFDAFVELSDIRATLAMFDGTAMARHRTRQILSGQRPDELRLDDTSAYWLVPAALGLHALTGGDLGTARVRFAEAAERDPLRAEVFSILATAVAAPEHAPALAGPVLPKLLPALPHEVDRWQRALWLLAADGLLGEDAREELRLRTDTALREQGLPQGDDSTRRIPRVELKPERAPVNLSGTGEIQQRLLAAEQLSALRERLEHTLVTPSAPGADDAGRRRTAPARFAAETLRLLIDEGSSEEAPLIERAAQLRAVVEGSGSASADSGRPRWDARVGTLSQLLHADATDTGAPADRRAFALSFESARTLSAAESLAHRAQQPWRGDVVITEQGQRVPITRDGPVGDALADAEAQIARRYMRGGSEHRHITLSAAAIGVVLVAVGLSVGSPVLWIIGIAAFGCSGWGVYKDSSGRQQTMEFARHQQERMRTSVDQGVAYLGALLDKTEADGARADRDLDAIRRLLADG